MVDSSRNACVLPIGFSEARWTKGFWNDIFDHCDKTMIFSMETAMWDKSNSAYLGNFDAASGAVPDRHWGTYWSDGDCYKWLEAVAHVYSVTKEAELDALMDRYIVLHHELYNFGHLFTSASTHFMATGKTEYLDIARKAGNCLYKVFSPRPKKLVHYDFNPSQIMGCMDLYRTTGDEIFLELAVIFVEMRGSADGGSDQYQTRVPIKEEDEALKVGLERIWENIASRKLYVTGGIAPNFEGIASRGDRTSVSFAWEYQLPNRRGYSETCADSRFETRFDPDFFEGATIISTDCMIYDSGAFGSALYRKYVPGKARRERIEFIPYYLWAIQGVIDDAVR